MPSCRRLCRCSHPCRLQDTSRRIHDPRDLDIPEDEKQQLQQDLEKARSRGYDCTHNTWTEGLFAVGFPIYDSSNQLVGGLSMGVVDDSKSFEVLERCISQGHLLAVEINNRMGSNYYSQLK